MFSFQFVRQRFTFGESQIKLLNSDVSVLTYTVLSVKLHKTIHNAPLFSNGHRHVIIYGRHELVKQVGYFRNGNSPLSLQLFSLPW